MKKWSVELEANTWNDDTFTGTFNECVEYCKSHDYKIDGVEARLAEINTEDGYCYQIFYNVVQCDVRDCINCKNVGCFPHPGNGYV